MHSKILRNILLLPTFLFTAHAASSTACNNSPALCTQTYNNVTHLGSHNAPFLRDASTDNSLSGNQYYNTTVQLSAGVRLLTAQVHSADSAWHLCHTSCALLDAGTLSDWLAEIKTWMDANTDEVVTVLLVNSDGASASDLAGQYSAAGITDYVYTPETKAATNEWPTLEELISNGTRLMTFVASLSDNSAAPYLMDQYTYVFENSYNNIEPADFSCVPDAPSSVANDTSAAISGGYMPLMNHFLYEQQAFNIQLPNDTYVATTNAPSGGAGNLGAAASTCENAYGRAPTFIVVDFFNMGPAIATVDRLNGVTDPVGRMTVSKAEPSDTSAAVSVAAVKSGMLCLTFLAALLGVA